MTPAKHFQLCGPFCKHVQLCQDCVNVHGLCAQHQENPDATFSWADPSWQDGMVCHQEKLIDKSGRHIIYSTIYERCPGCEICLPHKSRAIDQRAIEIIKREVASLFQAVKQQGLLVDDLFHDLTIEECENIAKICREETGRFPTITEWKKADYPIWWNPRCCLDERIK